MFLQNERNKARDEALGLKAGQPWRLLDLQSSVLTSPVVLESREKYITSRSVD